MFWHTYDYWNGNPALIGIQIPLNLISTWTDAVFSHWLAVTGIKPKPVAGYTEKSDKCIDEAICFRRHYGRRDAVPSLIISDIIP